MNNYVFHIVFILSKCVINSVLLKLILLLYISVVVNLVFQSTYISFFLSMCYNSSFVIHFSFLYLPIISSCNLGHMY